MRGCIRNQSVKSIGILSIAALLLAGCQTMNDFPSILKVTGNKDSSSQVSLASPSSSADQNAKQASASSDASNLTSNSRSSQSETQPSSASVLPSVEPLPKKVVPRFSVPSRYSISERPKTGWVIGKVQLRFNNPDGSFDFRTGRMKVKVAIQEEFGITIDSKKATFTDVESDQNGYFVLSNADLENTYGVGNIIANDNELPVFSNISAWRSNDQRVIDIGTVTVAIGGKGIDGTILKNSIGEFKWMINRDSAGNVNKKDPLTFTNNAGSENADLLSTFSYFSQNGSEFLRRAASYARNMNSGLEKALPLSKEADKATEDGKIDEAVRIYRQVTSVYPEDPNNWIKLSTSLRAQGDYMEAGNVLVEAVQRCPWDDKILKNLAYVYEDIGRHDLMFEMSEQLYNAGYSKERKWIFVHYVNSAITMGKSQLVKTLLGTKPTAEQYYDASRFASGQKQYGLAMELTEIAIRYEGDDTLKDAKDKLEKRQEWLRKRVLMERRWASYLQDIQESGDYTNWRYKPYDYYKYRFPYADFSIAGS